MYPHPFRLKDSLVYRLALTYLCLAMSLSGKITQIIDYLEEVIDTVGLETIRMFVITEKQGDMIIIGRRPYASDSPPMMGLTMNPRMPDMLSRFPCTRA